MHIDANEKQDPTVGEMFTITVQAFFVCLFVCLPIRQSRFEDKAACVSRILCNVKQLLMQFTLFIFILNLKREQIFVLVFSYKNKTFLKEVILSTDGDVAKYSLSYNNPSDSILVPFFSSRVTESIISHCTIIRKQPLSRLLYKQIDTVYVGL